MNNIKTFLTILFVIILNEHTYSQQKEDSKILSFLSGELKDNNLYNEPMDSIIKKFKGNIVNHKKNLNLSDDPKYLIQPNTNTIYDEIITILPTDIVMFHVYRPDTIYFYFKAERLVKGHFHFIVDRNAAENNIADILDLKLGRSQAGGDYKGLHYILWDDQYNVLPNVIYAKLNYVYDLAVNNDKNKVVNAYLDFIMLKPPESNIAENQTKERPVLDYSTFENQIKTDRSGKGNSTFNISIAKLESIVILKTTLKGLEAQLGNWNSYGNLNDIGAEYDDNTKNFTIPLFQIHYETTVKNNGYLIEADVSKSLKNPVKELQITTTLNGYQLAQLKESLHAHGYLLNENLSATLNKLSYNNKARRLITIRYNENGSYTIGIFK